MEITSIASAVLLVYSWLCALSLEFAWATPVSRVPSVPPDEFPLAVFGRNQSSDDSITALSSTSQRDNDGVSPPDTSIRSVGVNVSAPYSLVRVGGEQHGDGQPSKFQGAAPVDQNSSILEHRSLPDESAVEIGLPAEDNVDTSTKAQYNFQPMFHTAAGFRSSTPAGSLEASKAQGLLVPQNLFSRRIAGGIPQQQSIISRLPANPQNVPATQAMMRPPDEELLLRRAGYGAPVPVPQQVQQPVVYSPPLVGVFGKRTDRNILDPIFRFIFATTIIVLFVWLFSFIQTYASLPTRFFFGIKLEVILSYLARLLSYMGQIFVNNLQSSFPLLGGSFSVPAKGLQISRPPSGNVPGFTLDIPATTIRYSYNLSTEAATKLQALLDAFNEVLNIAGGPVAAAAGRSGDADDAFSRLERVLDIAGEMREVAGDKCQDNPLAVRQKTEKELCSQFQNAVEFADSLKPRRRARTVRRTERSF